MNRMKAHKKWWIKFIKTEPRYIPSISPRELTEIGFRAALEWMRELDTDQKNIQCDDGSIIWDVRSRWSVAKCKIREELTGSEFLHYPEPTSSTPKQTDSQQDDPNNQPT